MRLASCRCTGSGRQDVALVDLYDEHQPSFPRGRETASQILETCTGTWEFDVGNRRFRHLPPGVATKFRVSDEGWQPYARLELDGDGTGFTVVLNHHGTRVLRANRHRTPCPSCAAR